VPRVRREGRTDTVRGNDPITDRAPACYNDLLLTIYEERRGTRKITDNFRLYSFDNSWLRRE